MYTIFMLSKCLHRQIYIKVYFTEMYWHMGKKTTGTPTAHKQVKKQLSVCFEYTIVWREWYQNTLEYWFQIQASLHNLLLLHRKSLLLFLVIVFPICCKLHSLVCFYDVFFFCLFSLSLCSVYKTFIVCVTHLVHNNWNKAEVYFSVENTLLRVFLLWCYR